MPDGNVDVIIPIDGETFLEAYRRIKDRAIEKEMYAAAHRSSISDAKAKGTNLIALKFIEQLEKKSPEQAERILRDVLLYANYLEMRVGRQMELDMTPEGVQLTERVVLEHRTWQTERNGRKAGFDGEPRDNNPHSPGSESNVLWDKGWHVGVADRKLTQSSSITDADDTIGRDEPPEE